MIERFTAALLAVCAAGAITTNATAKDLGVEGQLYEILEVDMRAWFFQKMSKVDWERVNDQLVSEARAYGRNHQPLAFLPSETLSIEPIDLTYTLNDDIVAPQPQQDGTWQWEVIWEAGTTVDPHQFPVRKPGMFFFSGLSEQQVEMAKSIYAHDPHGVFLVANGGDLVELTESIGTPVFGADTFVVEQLKLEHMPAFVDFNNRDNTRVIYSPPPFDPEPVTSRWEALPVAIQPPDVFR